MSDRPEYPCSSCIYRPICGDATRKTPCANQHTWKKVKHK